MIGRGFSLQKIEEVHVAPTSRLDSSGAEEMVHAGIDENGEQLPGGRQLFVDTAIGAIERGQIHPSDTLAQQANWVILGNLHFKIQGQAGLISFAPCGIIWL